MYSEIASNKRKTVLLIGGFIGLIGLLTYIAGLYYQDFTITVGALIGSIIYVLISYYSSARLALTFNGAQEIEKRDNPRLWRIVENLAITEGLPMPRVHIITDAGLNAFATGRDPHHAHVAITTGLLELLDDKELQGVMAHELGHVKNYDIRVSMVVFGLVMVVSFLADIFLRMSFYGSDDDDAPAWVALLAVVAMILAPIIAALVQASISRKREYLADATGALTTRYPEGLASALEKLKTGNTGLKRQNTSTAHLFFANPLKRRAFASLFDTHPPIDDRIAKLREMGNTL
ncbi:MAG TPA: M48 family metalloprotease [Candidatus Saccharibacteria bacterium]|jgi:heat shock protein HtpX|nr:M48 family metalloprotease [Candidatus Saccharibacteria bacterium]